MGKRFAKIETLNEEIQVLKQSLAKELKWLPSLSKGNYCNYMHIMMFVELDIQVYRQRKAKEIRSVFPSCGDEPIKVGRDYRNCVHILMFMEQNTSKVLKN